MPQHRRNAWAGWKALVLLALALAGAFSTNSLMQPQTALAQSVRVDEVRVIGNRRVEPETVRSYLQFSVGDASDTGKVDRSLRALFATRLSADVSLDREGSTVV